MSDEMKIEQTKQVWVAWTNEDCTEGRGREYPLAVCETMETASRIGAGRYVQGSDCNVTEEMAVKINGKWLMPGRLHFATEQDMIAMKQRLRKQAAIEKARQLGMTEQELLDIMK